MAKIQIGQLVELTANEMNIRNILHFIQECCKFYWFQITKHFDPDVLREIDPIFWCLFVKDQEKLAFLQKFFGIPKGILCFW
jgi:hypothetical protein